VLHLFDTALAAVVPLEPRVPGQLSIYLCGPTVYAEPHVGHGRMTVTWDVLRRYLSWSGLRVTMVSNVTDIDDKIIARANAEGRSAADVAATWEARWWETMDRLGVARPDQDPHATDWVPQMIELIAGLIETGHAYVGGNGVYFAAETVADYGLLARQPLDSLRAGARLAPDDDAGKRAPIDFVLWKNAKAGEPSWDSPWGPGRPGWHTECVVMSLGLLGDDFDLHGGGIDLAFPHHENERAQAVAAGRTFAQHWVHSGMVVTDGGEKMARSLGNGLSLSDLLATYDPRVVRLLVLQAHYRSPLTINPTTLAAGAETLRGLDLFARNHRERVDPETGLDRDAVARFVERMDDDLDTPRAVAQLFELRREANSAPPERAAVLAATVISLFEDALGLPLGGAGSDGPADIPAEIVALMEQRDAARAARDWASADRLRQELEADGWIVEDGAAGTKIRR
jgi:cysteinyl-tRNA synthetase